MEPTYTFEWLEGQALAATRSRKLAPEPPLRNYIDLPEIGERAALQVHGHSAVFKI